MIFNRAFLVAFLVAVVGGCTCADKPPVVPPVSKSCVDFDGDGFGSEPSGKACNKGLDCYNPGFGSTQGFCTKVCSTAADCFVGQVFPVCGGWVAR